MSLIYLELARVAHDERTGTYSPDSIARLAAARLRAAADRCCRTLAARLHDWAGSAWRPPAGSRAAPACC
jgi:hypothetical protein